MVRFVLAIMVTTTAPGCASSQEPPPPPPPAAAAETTPRTKLEAFKPAAGTLTTFGYDDLGGPSKVSVDVREMRSEQSTVRGLVVTVAESQYRTERSFVDADEIMELLRAVDALLEVTENPTAFTHFEVQYATRGDLQVVAFNSPSRGNQISYSIRAGRVTSAASFVSGAQLREFQKAVVAANAKLDSLAGRTPSGPS